MRPNRFVSGLALAALLLIQGWIAPAGLRASAAPGDETASPPAPAQIDINSAGEEALRKIPGVGDALAKRIVDFRKQHGPFERVEDLMKIRGIGEKSFEKMRPYVKVGKRK